MTLLATGRLRTLPWQAAAIAVALAAFGAFPGAFAAVNEAEAGPAEDAAAKRGLAGLVKITLPLAAGSDASLQLTLTRARDRLLERAREAGDGQRPVLVLEIAPGPSANDGGAGSEFEPALALATLLTSRDMNDVKTVAWLPQSIRGHGVLVAMACDEIVMPADAEIGEAGVDEPADKGGPSDTVIAAYREIARLAGRIPEGVAQSFVDPTVEVVQVESEEGLRLIPRSEVDEFRQDHEVMNEQVLVPAGALARFNGREAFQFGFVRRPAADRAALAQGLGVESEALVEDQSLLAEWQPVMLEIKGEVTPRTASQLKTLLGQRLEGGVNWVGVRIDSVGGDLPACFDLAATLASLDPNSVRTVAYVAAEARGGAAIIALSCDQLVMHPGATIGVGPQRLAPPPQQPPRDNRQLPPPRPGQQPPPPPPRDEAVDMEVALDVIRTSLAPKTDHGWSLLAAMLDGSIELATYRNKTSGQKRIMSADEAGALPDAVNWAREAAIVANNQPLALTGAQAAPLGLAQTVDNFDQLKRLYGLDDIETVEPDWALTLVQALASPGLATFLLFVGFIGMYIELKTPGIGIGGVVAAVAFLLFFWSKYLEGTAESLEILMFVGGMVLMLLEVFVVPGVGIFGLTGALLVLFSLILASQTFIVPRSQAQLDQLAGSIAMLVTAGLGMIVLAIAVRRYLPKAPLFNRMVLEPPPLEERISLSHREALADFSHLVGQSGEAVTDLRPSGRALVDDQLVDVIAAGEPIDRGEMVEVVSAHANRVVVRRVT
jgi:membrane-bound serine protease (ClpP class)